MIGLLALQNSDNTQFNNQDFMRRTEHPPMSGMSQGQMENVPHPWAKDNRGNKAWTELPAMIRAELETAARVAPSSS